MDWRDNTLNAKNHPSAPAASRFAWSHIPKQQVDRLYTDWSALAKFQRTRGVLRLMVEGIHYEVGRGDRSPLILPGNIALEDARVQAELTRYLDDHWTPIIEKDVDGAVSLPLRIDADQPNLGKFSASRRVARAIFLGSAPSAPAPPFAGSTTAR